MGWAAQRSWSAGKAAGVWRRRLSGTFFVCWAVTGVVLAEQRVDSTGPSGTVWVETALQADAWPWRALQPSGSSGSRDRPRPLGPSLSVPGPVPAPPLTLGKAQLLRWGLGTPEDLDRVLVFRCGGPSPLGPQPPCSPPQGWSWALLQPAPPMLQRPLTELEGPSSRRRIWAGDPHQLHVLRSKLGRPCRDWTCLQLWEEPTGRKRALTGPQGAPGLCSASAASLDTALGRVPPAPGAPGGTGWGAWRGEPGACWGLPEASQGLGTQGWRQPVGVADAAGRGASRTGLRSLGSLSPADGHLLPGSAPLTTTPLGSQAPCPHPRSSRILTRGIV